jgi:tetratricopeptide (TPR) repeat protein
MTHLIHHKPRLTILRAKIEGLPDHHRSKPRCLSSLAELFEALGNYVEQKRLQTHTLRLWRERGNERGIVRALMNLSSANREMGLYGEGVEMAKEALEILERLGKIGQQGRCLKRLARLYHSNNEFDAAEEAASRAMDLVSKEGNPYRVCGAHRLLGVIYRSRGETEKGIHHLEAALGLASASDWQNELHRIHLSLARLFLIHDGFDKAQAHVEHAKSYASSHSYYLADATSSRLSCGTNRGGSKRQGLRHCALPTRMRGSGLRKT